MEGWTDGQKKKEGKRGKEKSQRRKVTLSTEEGERVPGGCVGRVCVACIGNVSEVAFGVVESGGGDGGGECGLTSCQNVGRSGGGGGEWVTSSHPSYCCCAEPAE